MVQQKVSALDVKAEIINALKRHARTEAKRIQVSVHNGVVTLAGHVDNYPEKEMVEQTALHTSGVNRVVNKLEIDRYYPKAAA